MSSNELTDALALLISYVPAGAAMQENYTLDRIKKIMSFLGDPQDRYPVIHIAGTSGKTSTAYFIRGLLQAAGQLTGLTISPHMLSITERVQIDGKPLADGVFGRKLREFIRLVDSSGVPTTYFEILVAFAYQCFAESQVKYAVVETGLGGLLDGTNTVSSPGKLCVIADIGLDHTEILGRTIEEIAQQKAGIIQPGNHVLMLNQKPSVEKIIREAAKRRNAHLEIFPAPQTEPAAGHTFQARNWALATAAYSHLAPAGGLASIESLNGIEPSAMQPPGRLERLMVSGRPLILDGAHNPQKMEALRSSLAAIGIHRAAIVANFIDAPEEKLEAVTRTLQPLAAHLIVPGFAAGQDMVKESCNPVETAERAKRLGYRSVEVVPDPIKALAALVARPEKILLVTGSLYLVSIMRNLACSDAQFH